MILVSLSGHSLLTIAIFRLGFFQLRSQMCSEQKDCTTCLLHQNVLNEGIVCIKIKIIIFFYIKLNPSLNPRLDGDLSRDSASLEATAWPMYLHESSWCALKATLVNANISLYVHTAPPSCRVPHFTVFLWSVNPLQSRPHLMQISSFSFEWMPWTHITHTWKNTTAQMVLVTSSFKNRCVNSREWFTLTSIHTEFNFKFTDAWIIVRWLPCHGKRRCLEFIAHVDAIYSWSLISHLLKELHAQGHGRIFEEHWTKSTI